MIWRTGDLWTISHKYGEKLLEIYTRVEPRKYYGGLEGGLAAPEPRV